MAMMADGVLMIALLSRPLAVTMEAGKCYHGVMLLFGECHLCMTF
jgi:hypothetical protein